MQYYDLALHAVGNVAGVNTYDANAVAANLLSGKTAYVAGAKITGAMNEYGNNYGGVQASGIQTPGSNVLRLNIPYSGHYDDTSYIWAQDNDWIPSNILNGVNIFGITGTASGRKFASGTGSPSNSTWRITVTGLTFQPQMVFIWCNVTTPTNMYHRKEYYSGIPFANCELYADNPTTPTLKTANEGWTISANGFETQLEGGWAGITYSWAAFG